MPIKEVEMRQIKIKRGVKESSQRKVAIEPGDIAPVGTDNFETLTTPPFKAKLNLIEADPHTPPAMNAQTDQNIKTEGDDPNKPSAKDLVKKKPEYEKSNDVAVEEVPHEGERVKQASQDEMLNQMKAEFAQKFSLASTLFDIKEAAGLEQPINKQNFIHSTASNSNITIASLQEQVATGQAFLGQMNQKKVASSGFPTPTTNGLAGPIQKRENPFSDDLEEMLMGSF